MRKYIIIYFIAFLSPTFLFCQGKGRASLVADTAASPRIKLGAAKLLTTLKSVGYSPVTMTKEAPRIKEKTIFIEELSSAGLKPEGFSIISSGDETRIKGYDASGILYGCIQLAEEIRKNGKLPPAILMTNQPEMVMRGMCIGLQKPFYLPGRAVYEYPYTPETFPWFYDKKLWLQVLDSMLENRMNSLYLWNGHPFASLVKLPDYPYAVEVTDATFKKNEEIYRFLTTEADKRGIWVVQMFYNIIVSKPFAAKHNIKTQDRERPIIPLISDYTRKSIAAFVQKYPNVGLMVCLGEAMEGTGLDDIEWFTKTIIPGVKDGLKALGKTEEPPIVLRAHDTDAPAVMNAALPLYKNLYTEAKFNGEALTYPRPRGRWAQLHQTLSRLGSVQIENVHIMANLEPFRYGSVDFIQQSVKGMHEVMEGNGLHLYPQASYWDWPFSADSVKGKRLLQIERDWIWYKAWSRYAWKVDRSRETEIKYWSGLLASRFGCKVEDGESILRAYEQSGEIAPKLLRRFGITDGNRQTLTLGMLMTQLINPTRYGLFTLLYESESPEGEMLVDYARKEWKGEKHIGETPVQIINEVKQHGDDAVMAIEAVRTRVTKNKEEFARLRNDMICYRQLAYHYAQKAEAALFALRYKYSNDINDLQKALTSLQQSVETYKALVNSTRGTYLYANSMQTQQRKIPIRGVDGTFRTWVEVLAPFQAELNIFKQRVDSIRRSQSLAMRVPFFPKLEPVDIKPISSFDGFYKPVKGSKLFADTTILISNSADQLDQLNSIRYSGADQIRAGTQVKFRANEKITLLVGYFNTKDPKYLKAPELETNATANEYGQSDIRIANAILVQGMPPVNVHAYTFGPGEHELLLGKGICLVLGFVRGDKPVPVFDAALNDPGEKNIDWLFE